MTATRFAITRTFAILAAIILTVAAAPATSHAQIIDGCYAPRTGSVYRINTAGAPTQCSKGHTQFSWDAKNEITGISRVFSDAKVVMPGQNASLTVDCPAGKTPIHVSWIQGEAQDFSVGAPIIVFTSTAWNTTNSGIPQSWHWQFHNPGSVPRNIMFILGCATAKLTL